MALKMKYFVLKPKGKDPYAKASRAAMRTYADSIEEENKQLAKELRKWTTTEDRQQFLTTAPD